MKNKENKLFWEKYNEFWKEYNEQKVAYGKKVLDYNNRNEFNFIEESSYPHVRDLSALVIANLANTAKDSCLKVLDYGSNTTSIVNLKHKIATQKIKYVIYDPTNSHYSKNKDLDFIDYYVVSDHKELERQYFDLTIFGSSIQYIPEVFDVLGKTYITNSSQILFTCTPLSLGEQLIFKQQDSSYTGDVIHHSYQELKDFFQEKYFDLIFKSNLSLEFARMDKKYWDKVVLINLLFSRRL